jgi:hypothetical protein
LWGAAANERGNSKTKDGGSCKVPRFGDKDSKYVYGVVKSENVLFTKTEVAVIRNLRCTLVQPWMHDLALLFQRVVVNISVETEQGVFHVSLTEVSVSAEFGLPAKNTVMINLI